MTQPTLRTPALDARARAALATEFARALESPGLRPLPPRLTGAFLPRFARYYDQLLHLPRSTRRALQRRCKRSLAALALLLALGQAPPALADVIPCGDNAALIQAMNEANNDPGLDIITLSANCTQTLTAADNSTYGPTGLPVISSTITIEGQGSTIKRDPADPDQFRIFAINANGNLTLNETTVSGGAATGGANRGGGVYNNRGTATLTNSTVSGNSAAGDGGGVYNSGTATLTNSTVSGNSARFGGGGVFNYQGTATLTNSTVSGNSAAEGGGVDNFGTVTLTNSTVSGNSAVNYGGGGVLNFGTATLTNSTVSGNSAREGGGVINNGGMTLTNSTVSGNSASDARFGGGVYNRIIGTLNLANTILANSTSGRDCNNAGALNASGVNLVEDGSCDPGAITGDPKLGPLANNSGPTKTHALLAGSPAIDAVTDGSCPPPNEDQRGVARPQDGDGDTFAACDIGSFEVMTLCDTVTPTFGCTVNGVRNQACVGTGGADTIVGTNGPDVILGRGGIDTLSGGNAEDVICGGEGNDTLKGGNGKDRLFGENGNDALNGDNDNDALDGGAGSDTCNGGNGKDTGANCEPFNQ